MTLYFLNSGVKCDRRVFVRFVTVRNQLFNTTDMFDIRNRHNSNSLFCWAVRLVSVLLFWFYERLVYIGTFVAFFFLPM